MNGRLRIEQELQLVSIYSDDGTIVDSIPYCELTPSDWGYVYERHVAQELAANGFEIQMQGLKKGFIDEGIDLVVKSPSNEMIYIQCKYVTQKKISKEKVEWILYKASSHLEKMYSGKKIKFWLIVPSLREAFLMKRSPLGREIYPVAQYFLSKRDIQSKIWLEIHEISMQR